MAFLRSRLALITLALAVALASLAVIAITSLPASSHGNVVARECNVAGISGDTASLRGIQFYVTQSFVSVEVNMDASVAGDYGITAELRRSTGFTAPLLAAYRVTVSLPGTSVHPYPSVHFEFPPIFVLPLFGSTFTLKFVDITGPGTLYIEQVGFNDLCPNVMETEENNVAVPTERSDPAGFKVLALRSVRWGDVDCSNSAPGATDALKILRYAVGLPITQTPPCPALGDFVRP